MKSIPQWIWVPAGGFANPSWMVPRGGEVLCWDPAGPLTSKSEVVSNLSRVGSPGKTATTFSERARVRSNFLPDILERDLKFAVCLDV